MIPILRSAALLCAILLGAGAWLSGCSNDDSSPPAQPGGPTGPFTGTYVDAAGFGGVLSFTIEGSAGGSLVATMLAAGDVAGTVQDTGVGTVALSGSYAAASGLDLQGSGFQFQGVLQSDGHFQGSCCVTPRGPLAWATYPGDATSVQVLCGSYSRCTDPGCSLPVYLYPLSVAVAGSSATVAVIELAQGQPVTVPGILTSSGSQVFLDFDFGQVHASGELLPGSTASGDWADSGGSGDTGIWSASAAQCLTGS